MTLGEAIRYVTKQHDEGIKLPDLLEELCIMKEDNEILSCTIGEVLDAIERDNDMDYIIYGCNRYFVFMLT